MTDLKYIVGKAEASRPAVMRFYGPVDQYSCRDFVYEFDWLVKSVQPSEIIVFINSEGGSVISGMQVFAAINSCPIETKCVIDGIAASMGSIIWAAGKRLFMRDYSILMIHNPSMQCEDSDDKDAAVATEAFRQQLETVYVKRFGMSAEDVKSIMDGEEGGDGTYLTAKQAVEKGILPAENIIETSEQVRAMMSEKVAGVDNAVKVAGIMASVNLDGVIKALKQESSVSQVPVDNLTNNSNNRTMNDKEQSFDLICATLGLATDASKSAVTAKVQELANVQAALKDVQAQLDKANKTVADLQIQLEGKSAEVKNLSASLEDTKASLKEYQDAEAKAKDTAIAAMVEAAIKEGKIQAQAKEQWINMAKANMDLAKSTLDSIPAREDILGAIGSDPDNLEKSQDQTQKELQAKVNEVVGKNFEFKKFQ